MIGRPAGGTAARSVRPIGHSPSLPALPGGPDRRRRPQAWQHGRQPTLRGGTRTHCAVSSGEGSACAPRTCSLARSCVCLCFVCVCVRARARDRQQIVCVRAPPRHFQSQERRPLVEMAPIGPRSAGKQSLLRSCRRRRRRRSMRSIEQLASKCRRDTSVSLRARQRIAQAAMQTNKHTDGRTDGRTHGRTAAQTGGQTSERASERTDGRTETVDITH